MLRRFTILLMLCVPTGCVGSAIQANQPLVASAPVPELAGIPLLASRSVVALYSSVPLDGDRLAGIAEKTIRATRAWLGADPLGCDPFAIFLCRDRTELERIAQALSLAQASDTRLRAGGGYFHEQRSIAVIADGSRHLDWVLAHESWHLVFRDLVRVHPVSLNEGLGEVLPSWILFSDEARPEDAHATYSDYERYLASYEPWRSVPTIQELLDAEVEQFHRDRWVSFSFSWSLVRFLLESEDPGVRGRLPRLLRQLGTRTTAWEEFCHVYDAEHVEALWRASLARNWTQDQ